MQKAPLAILLANLGTPEAPTPQAVRAFLKPFLSDRRVVEVPRPIWWIILNCFILPFRPKPVSHGYQAMWQEYGDSPLRIFTQQQVQKLTAALAEQYGKDTVLVDYVFTYGKPGIAAQIEHYRARAEKILVLPLYPQYSCSTTAAIYDQIASYNMQQRDVADITVIKDYYCHPAYRQALAQSVRQFWEKNGRSEHLLISNHGVPKMYAEKGDPYYQQCLQTTENLKQDLGLRNDEVTGSFQSRLGRAEWLQPYTAETVKVLAKKGIKSIDVLCPSFAVDCLETLEEISIENAGYFKEAGGETLRLIPCLNASDEHIQMMQAIVKPYCSAFMVNANE
jgi:protoporphyrin/coproporphyrin ferrochelatase